MTDAPTDDADDDPFDDYDPSQHLAQLTVHVSPDGFEMVQIIDCERLGASPDAVAGALDGTMARVEPDAVGIGFFEGAEETQDVEVDRETQTVVFTTEFTGDFDRRTMMVSGLAATMTGGGHAVLDANPTAFLKSMKFLDRLRLQMPVDDVDAGAVVPFDPADADDADDG